MNHNHAASDQQPMDALPGVLEQIALIAAPATIIGFFCVVLHVPEVSNAAVCLLSSVLTAICIYRRRLNRAVPSALLAALLVGLATVFFLNYQNILLKNTG